jgi:hypothetical protein
LACNRQGEIGAVLFVVEESGADYRAIFGLYKLVKGRWEEAVLFSNPWLDSPLERPPPRPDAPLIECPAAAAAGPHRERATGPSEQSLYLAPGRAVAGVSRVVGEHGGRRVESRVAEATGAFLVMGPLEDSPGPPRLLAELEDRTESVELDALPPLRPVHA